MIQLVPLLFWTGLGALVVTRGDGVLGGHGPFDEMPPGTQSGKPLSIDNVRASSGRAYRVTAFKRGYDQVLYVAERTDGSSDWVSYLHNTKTKVRFLYRADAEHPEALANLQKDFAL